MDPWWALDWGPFATCASIVRLFSPRKILQFFSNFLHHILRPIALTFHLMLESTIVFSMLIGHWRLVGSRSAKSFLAFDQLDSCFRWKNTSHPMNHHLFSWNTRRQSCESHPWEFLDFWRWMQDFHNRWGVHSLASYSRVKAHYCLRECAALLLLGSARKSVNVNMIL